VFCYSDGLFGDNCSIILEVDLSLGNGLRNTFRDYNEPSTGLQRGYCDLVGYATMSRWFELHTIIMAVSGSQSTVVS
jgi:hypothetical protein